MLELLGFTLLIIAAVGIGIITIMMVITFSVMIKNELRSRDEIYITSKNNVK